MQRRSVGNPVRTQDVMTSEADRNGESPRRLVRASPETEPRRGRAWFGEPKSAVWIVLAAIVLVGGGLKLRWGLRARKSVSRLRESGVSPEQIEAVAEFGRSGAWELFRIFSSVESEPSRLAAGRALARLWRDDHLVAEEEQAVVRRGFSVTWKAPNDTHGRSAPAFPSQ